MTQFNHKTMPKCGNEKYVSFLGHDRIQIVSDHLLK